MVEKGLRVLQTDKTFFGKLTNTITKMLIPTQIGINGILTYAKRNNLLKAFENCTSEEKQDITKKELLEKKYEDMYGLYLESIDKYIMESIYKKVKNETATNFEKNALSKYYTIIHLKETQYLEYKYRKQKYLLELDYETIHTQSKEKLIKRYKKFYINKMESLYKGILKNYSIQLADNATTKQRKEEIYESIFITLEEYITQILPIKLEINKEETYKEVIQEYEKFTTFLAGKLDEKDIIEKKIVLLGISRKLFTHSLPLIVAEQGYIQLIKETRNLILKAKTTIKKLEAYELLIRLIQDYNIKLLSTKIYWDKPDKREEYKKFWAKYNEIDKLKETDINEYKKKKEILFIKSDLKAVKQNKEKYRDIIKFYNEILSKYGEVKLIKNTIKKISGRYTKKRLQTV